MSCRDQNTLTPAMLEGASLIRPDSGGVPVKAPRQFLMTPKEAVDWMIFEAELRPEKIKRLLLAPLRSQVFLHGYGSSVDTNHAHHAYPGGLAVHTAEVLENAIAMASAGDYLQKPNLDVLVPAAILHDVAKWYDYDEQGKKTDHGRKIYHVAGSYEYFCRAARRVELDFELTQQISHCILSHHGRKEWGSPSEPQTVEAQILHFADYLSMSYGAGR